MRKLSNWIYRHIKRILIIEVVIIISIIVIALNIEEPATAEDMSIKDSTYSSVDFSWDKVDNATAYRVYKSEDGKNYEYLASVTDNEFQDTKLKTGKTYYYTITSRNGLKTSSLDKTKFVEVTPSLETPSLEIDSSKGQIELKYSEVPGASGYKIYRDGDIVGSSKETTFIDNSVFDGEYNYEVRAYRYEKEPVFSELSNKEKGVIHSLNNIKVDTIENDLVIEWDKNDNYKTYKIYDGEQNIADVNENQYKIEKFEADKIYDIKIVGYNDEIESPVLEKKFKILKEDMTTEEAIQEAIIWGVSIANDDEFTYGVGERAHNYGCYFCGTNTGPRMNIKGKSKVDGHSYEKTYCCNPFVHACFAHGAGDEAMLKACQNGHGIAMTVQSFTRYGNWIKVKKPSQSKLQPGDVLVRDNHVMLYIGDGKIVHASGGGWDADSITVTNLGNRYSSVKFVMRYTGNGRGYQYTIEDVE